MGLEPGTVDRPVDQVVEDKAPQPSFVFDQVGQLKDGEVRESCVGGCENSPWPG